MKKSRRPISALVYTVLVLNGIMVSLFATWFYASINETRRENLFNLNFADVSARFTQDFSIKYYPLSVFINQLNIEINSYQSELQALVLDQNRNTENIEYILENLEAFEERLESIWVDEMQIEVRSNLSIHLLLVLGLADEILVVDDHAELQLLVEDYQENFVALNAGIESAQDELNTLMLMATKASSEAAASTKLNVIALNQRLSAMSERMLWVFFVVFLVMMFTQVVLSRLINSRLSALSRYAKMIENGIYTQEIPFEARDSTGELAHSIRSMSKTLISLLAKSDELAVQAEQASRAKSDFLANMSHEIRTPMNAILGFSKILTRKVVSPEEQSKFSHRILQASNGLLTILNDLLDYSKMEAGKLEIMPVAFNLVELLDRQISLFSSAVNDNEIELTFDLGSDVPQLIKADDQRIGQVLTNLVGNAVKFTLSGEIEITVRSQDDQEGNVLLEFIVRDTGVGIPEEHQDRLFQSFTQVDATVTRTFGGTGLGLAISKKLVGLMGGEIGLSSKPDEGSQFRFTICAEPIKMVLVAPRDHGLVILASGHQALQDGLASCLCREGFNPEQVNSLDQLLARKIVDAQHDISLLVIDDKLISLEGNVDLDKIKKKYGEAIPILLLTSQQRNVVSLEQDKTNRAVNCSLQKPICQMEFINQVNASLAHSDPNISVELDTPEHFYLGGLHGLRVLVAEDQEMNQQLILYLLDEMGVVTTICPNGEETISAVNNGRFDVVLMDLQMPGMGGLEATKIIRETHSFKDLPIIALSAKAMDSDRDECRAAGMNDFASKPYVEEELYNLLKRWSRPQASSDTLSSQDKRESI